jgi:hypothetical protein
MDGNQIFNYDETNLADNPNANKFLYRRGVKYPDKVVNYTKSLSCSVVRLMELFSHHMLYTKVQVGSATSTHHG